MVDPRTGERRMAQLGSPQRLRTIYDTNLRMSIAHGRWQRIERTREALPYLMYVATLDSRTRPDHRARDGTVLPVDHPWWRTHYPPNGWYCRCSVIQLSEDDLARHPLSPGPKGPEGSRPWVNERTGESIQVPVRIDPGFAHNAGLVDPGLEGKRLLDAKRAAAGIGSASTLDDYVAAGRADRMRLVADAGGVDDPGLPAAFRADLARRMAASRGAGSVAADVAPSNPANAPDVAAAGRVRDAAAALPASWVRKANGAGTVEVRSDPSPAENYFRPLQRQITLGYFGPGERGRALHEYAHALQDPLPALQGLFAAMHVRRTTDAAGVRHPVVPLKYYATTGRPDDYPDRMEYAGAHYDFADADDALEMLTRHLQVVFDRLPEKEMLRILVRDDPEMLDLVLGVLLFFDP